MNIQLTWTWAQSNEILLRNWILQFVVQFCTGATSTCVVLRKLNRCHFKNCHFGEFYVLDQMLNAVIKGTDMTHVYKKNTIRMIYLQYAGFNK